MSSSKLRDFSRKGAKAQSFSDLRTYTTTPIFLCALAALREPITIFWLEGPPHPARIATVTGGAASLGLKKILTRLAKLEDEIAMGRNELAGLLG